MALIRFCGSVLCICLAPILVVLLITSKSDCQIQLCWWIHENDLNLHQIWGWSRSGMAYCWWIKTTSSCTEACLEGRELLTEANFSIQFYDGIDGIDIYSTLKTKIYPIHLLPLGHKSWNLVVIDNWTTRVELKHGFRTKSRVSHWTASVRAFQTASVEKAQN